MSHIRNVPNPWDDFLSLTDTPSSYGSQANKFVRVNAGADALEFTDDVVQKSGSTMTGFLVLHSDPTNAMHAVTKQYVDGIAQGLDIHESVRVATTVAGGDLDLAGIETIDSILLVAGDRVLVKNQTDPEENGIYVVVDPGAWTRATDADANGEITAGMFVFVEEGTVNGDTGWVLTTNDPIVVGTTELTFTQFAGAGTYTDGAGITITGMSIAVDFEDTDGNINDLGTADAGTSDLAARADHVHAHGDLAGGSLHDTAVAGVSDGFISAADQTKLDALPGTSTTGYTLYWDGTDWTESGIIFNDHANAEVGINTQSPNATLHVEGSISAKVVSTAVAYDMTSGTNADVHTVLCTNTGGGGDIAITLPAVAGVAGRVYHIKKVGATHVDDEVVITPTDGTIDGAATYTLNYQYESVTLVCNGSNWFIV